ncbi:hypothetical protein BDV11DRAFT_119436 [Aspergillus similis]
MKLKFINCRKYDSWQNLAQQNIGKQFDFYSTAPAHKHFCQLASLTSSTTGLCINIGTLERFSITSRNYLVNTCLPTWLGVDVSLCYVSTPPTSDDPIHIADSVEKGFEHVPVDCVFGTEDAVSAYERIVTKPAGGKGRGQSA